MNYFDVHQYYSIYTNFNVVHNNSCAVYLKQLTIEKFTGEFDNLTQLLKHIPNLKSLIISDGTDRNMNDASRWGNLITSLLSRLTVFNFSLVVIIRMIPFENFKHLFGKNHIIGILNIHLLKALYVFIQYLIYLTDISYNNIRKDI